MATEAGAVTTEAAAATTEAAAATTEAALATEVATSAPTASSAPTESSAPAGSAPASSAPGSSAPAGVPGAIVVGSANFPESELLAQIYGQALAAAGFDVSYELDIGSREVVPRRHRERRDRPRAGVHRLAAVVPRRSRRSPRRRTSTSRSTALGEALPEGLEVLTPSTAEDKDIIVCTQDVVDEYGLTEPVEPVRGQRRDHARRPRRSSRPARRSASPASARSTVPSSRSSCRSASADIPARSRAARSTAATSSRPTRRSRPRGSSPSRTIRTSCRTRRCCRSCAPRSSRRS